MSESEFIRGNKPRHATQYLTGAAASMGALAIGVVMGYSSPASVQLEGLDVVATCFNQTDCDYMFNKTACKLIHDEALTNNELSWFSSSVNLGSIIGASMAGMLMNKIGRRISMISSILGFAIGWALIGAAVNFWMLVAGRVVCGVSSGLVNVAVPTYLSEIASTDIRGLLSTGYQLMVTVGFLYVYAFGHFLCWQWLALASVAPAVVFAIGMFFSRESPSYLLIKDKLDEAKEALVYLRGKDYVVEPELYRLQLSTKETQENKGSFKDLLLPYNMKPLIISLSLVVFQQLSGITAILFNLSVIFESVGTSMSSDMSSIIIAAVLVLATGLASVLMDKAGRKVLLLISSAFMVVSLVAMGVFFYLKEQKGDDGVSSLGWLPLTSLVVYIAFFSIGFGPVPWVIMGEIFSPNIRDTAASLVTSANWIAAFIVSRTFEPLQEAINRSGIYWLFAGFCVVNFVFCLFVVKETKGKTNQELSAMFGAPQKEDAVGAGPSDYTQ